MQSLGQGGLLVDDDRSGFWQRVQEQVLVQEIGEESKYDTLIVDEGQDFEQEWFEIIQLFLREDANILWLEDGDQNLQDKPPVSLDGFVRYSSKINYRSPESIIRFIKDALPIPFEQGNDLPGLGVAVHGYIDADEQPKIVGKIVQQLMRHGFTRDDIVVITCRARRVLYSVNVIRSVVWVCGISRVSTMKTGIR